MAKPNIEDYATRLRAHCTASVTGSKAMVADQIAPNSVPFWVMQAGVPELIRKTRFQMWARLEFTMFLARGGTDSGLKNNVQIQLMDDMVDVLEYFHLRQDFVVSTYTTNPDFFIGGSLRVETNGQAEFNVQSGTLVGTLYTASWYHRMIQAETALYD